MSSQLGKLCSLLLQEYFGDTVERVATDLFKSGAKPLRLIWKSTKLKIEDVRRSLCLLIKYDLVNFAESSAPHVTEYQLNLDKVLLLLRYPKYLMLMKSLYGNEAEIIVEEIFKHGSATISSILITSYRRIYNTNLEEKESKLYGLRNIFEMLVNKEYIKKSNLLIKKKTTEPSGNSPTVQSKFPKINMEKLCEALSQNSFLNDENDSVLWQINFKRFDLDIRDDILILSMIRRVNAFGGEIMRFILQEMYLNSNASASVSNPILISDIKEKCQKAKVDNNITTYLEDYLAIMTEDYGGFLRKSNAINLAYEVNLKHAIIELTWCVLSNGVDAKFGSNAARIFRLIREQEFIEQDEIQKKAMLPDKEAKFLTYSLLQSGWIQQHELKKGLQKSGPTKTFYLFCVDFQQVVRMYLETCYKSLLNAFKLREQVKTENKCLLEKKQRIDAIILHMKKEGATDEQISEVEEMVTPPEHLLLEKIHLNINKISQAELQIDETLFILQLYISMNENE